MGSPEFWILVALLGLIGVGTRLWTSDRGQALLVRHGITHHFDRQLATRLDVALARSFLQMGLVRGNLHAKNVTENNRSVREYRFAAPQHLTPTQCHVRIRRAARAIDADVVLAEEHRERGEELVLWIGFGSLITHRVVVSKPARPETAPEPHHGPRIALIVDDFGQNMNRTARGFLDLGVPLTLAVLPDLPKSSDAFEAAQEHGMTALLHLPMQPEGHDNPGQNAVTTDMSPEQIDALIERHKRRYGSFIGVNNHMGSRATADPATMRALTQALRRHDLAFVDSQTTPHSLGASASREAGIWCLRNDLFLDDKAENADGVAANLERLARIARKRGLAVGIAHPHPQTLQALQLLLPRLQAEGIEFVTVESLRPQARVAAKAAAS